MWNRYTRAAVAAAALVAIAASSAAAQAANTPFSPPRTPDGKPDLQGVWQSLNAAHWDLEDHSARALSPEASPADGMPAGVGVVDGPIPYKPEALKKRQDNAANRRTLDPLHKCYLPGVPRIMYMPFAFQIFQKPTAVSIAFEYVHAFRTIFMDGSRHPEGHIDWWMGDSRGRWEGDTLVVDVTHHTEETWFDRAGNYHSDALHLVERYTLIGRDHLNYEVTVEDPKVFSRPWTIHMVMYRRKEASPQLLEYECFALEGTHAPISSR